MDTSGIKNLLEYLLFMHRNCSTLGGVTHIKHHFD